ncbi:MAG: hypothetical protein NTZ50_13405 [Chloroflexi bacterium]|nr:hypothetical protein [Chloroflexota bacterium]
MNTVREARLLGQRDEILAAATPGPMVRAGAASRLRRYFDGP